MRNKEQTMTKTNDTYKTIDAQTEKTDNRGPSLGRSVGKLLGRRGCLNKFYSREIMPFSLDVAPNIKTRLQTENVS